MQAARTGMLLLGEMMMESIGVTVTALLGGKVKAAGMQPVAVTALAKAVRGVMAMVMVVCEATVAGALATVAA